MIGSDGTIPRQGYSGSLPTSLYTVSAQPSEKRESHLCTAQPQHGHLSLKDMCVWVYM